MQFASLEAYFRALQGEKEISDLSLLPIQMVADHRGKSRGAIVRMIDLGQVKGITIDDTRFVQARSYIDLLSTERRRVDKVRTFLENTAAKRETVTYEPVMSQVGLRWQVPAHRTIIGGILGTISEESWKSDKTVLSVLVCQKATRRPGDGFFDLAGHLGLRWDKDDKDGFVQRETEKVWDRYAS